MLNDDLNKYSYILINRYMYYIFIISAIKNAGHGIEIMNLTLNTYTIFSILHMISIGIF